MHVTFKLTKFINFTKLDKCNFFQIKNYQLHKLIAEAST